MKISREPGTRSRTWRAPTTSSSSRTSLTLGGRTFHERARGAGSMVGEGRPLEELALLDHPVERGVIHEEVLAAVLLPRTRIARVFTETEYDEPVRVARQEPRRRVVPFPTPEGPAITMSRPAATEPARPRYFFPNRAEQLLALLGAQAPDATRGRDVVLLHRSSARAPCRRPAATPRRWRPSSSRGCRRRRPSSARPPAIRFPDFSSALISARFLRASAAFLRASARCSGVSVGRAMDTLLCSWKVAGTPGSIRTASDGATTRSSGLLTCGDRHRTARTTARATRRPDPVAPVIGRPIDEVVRAALDRRPPA